MASYRLLITRSAAKELETLPRKDRSRVVARIRQLAEAPRAPGAEKLCAREQYRVRQGSYRILYSVDDPNAVGVVVKVGHRRDVYR